MRGLKATPAAPDQLRARAGNLLETAAKVLGDAEADLLLFIYQADPTLAILSDAGVTTALQRVGDKQPDLIPVLDELGRVAADLVEVNGDLQKVRERVAERRALEETNVAARPAAKSPRMVDDSVNKGSHCLNTKHGAFAFYSKAARLAAGDDTGDTGRWFNVMMEQTGQDRTRTFMLQAWALLSERQQKELADTLASSMLKTLRGGGTEATIKNALRELVDARVTEQLAEREEEIVARVRKEVDARWEAEVETVVQQRVRAALDAVRAKL